MPGAPSDGAAASRLAAAWRPPGSRAPAAPGAAATQAEARRLLVAARPLAGAPRRVAIHGASVQGTKAGRAHARRPPIEGKTHVQA